MDVYFNKKNLLNTIDAINVRIRTAIFISGGYNFTGAIFFLNKYLLNNVR